MSKSIRNNGNDPRNNDPATGPQPPQARMHRLNLRLSQPEWDKIHRLAANSTCRSVSEYARKVLARKPVHVFYRNQSFDEFEEQMIGLLDRLEKSGEQFERMEKDLSALLDKSWSELGWSQLLELSTTGTKLLMIASEIKNLIAKIADHETQNNAQSQDRTVTGL